MKKVNYDVYKLIKSFNYDSTSANCLTSERLFNYLCKFSVSSQWLLVKRFK